MTEIIFDKNGILNLGAINKEEDLNTKGRIIINGPPSDGRCEVCNRHISELNPFGGPGDPLVGDFNGEILVKTWRPAGPYDEEAARAAGEAEREVEGSEDPLPWYISKYGKEKGEILYHSWGAYSCVGPSWECRECIVLDLDEYFEKLNQRYQGNENE